MASLAFLDKWSKYVVRDADLAPFTSLKLGGKAAALVRPPDVATLAAVLQACQKGQVPVRFLGSGTNVLVRDEGFPGVVVQFSSPAFQEVKVSGEVVHAKTGATLAALVSGAARAGLGGLESLVGLPGTVGGALKNDLKIKTGPLSQSVSRIELLDPDGRVAEYGRNDIPIEPLLQPAQGPVILSAEFVLTPDRPEAIVKSQQPPSLERTARLFRDPPGGTANQLIVQAGVQTSRVNEVTLNERDANYAVVAGRAQARDVIALMDLVASQVEERLGQTLQPSLVIW
jgi:UDP-N-acetylmuramate dehydrogenase